jgi:hypothetical protein
LVISGFLAIAFLIENSEECSLPFLIVTMTVPVILEECMYVLNAIRGQCFESLCWNTGLTRGLILGKFSDMLLYFSDRRTRTQCIKSGALGNVIDEGTSKTFHSSLLLLLIVVKCRNKVLVLGFEAIESSCRLTLTPILGYESPSMKHRVGGLGL